MNDIYDIEEPIKIIYKQNNYIYIAIILLVILLILFIFLRKKRNTRNISNISTNIFYIRIKNLNLNEDINKLLDELSLILKDYINDKENIDCRFLTTKEISNIISNKDIIVLLKELDYTKYAYIVVNKEIISDFIDRAILIVK